MTANVCVACGASLRSRSYTGNPHEPSCPHYHASFHRSVGTIRVVANRLQLAADRVVSYLTDPDPLERAAAFSKALGIMRETSAQLDAMGDMFEAAAENERRIYASLHWGKDKQPCTPDVTTCRPLGSASASCSGE